MSGRADEWWMLVRVEKNAKCEDFNHDQTKAKYVHHLIHTASNHLDQLKLVIDTHSCSMLSMSRKLSKSGVRVNEDGEGRIVVNVPSIAVAKGHEHIPLKPSQGHKCLLSSIDNEVNLSSFLQESCTTGSSLPGIYLTTSMTFASIANCF